MKILIAVLTIVFSSTSWASGFCFSHGQCQSIVDESTACFNVRLIANNKCEIKCLPIYAGSFCDFIPGKKYGKCKDENFKKEMSDSTDCKDAIPEDIFKDYL